MNPEEIVLALHRYFNGDTRWITERFHDGDSSQWRSREIEVPYTKEMRLEDSTYQSFMDTDGYPSLAALTYKDILEALEIILNDKL